MKFNIKDFNLWFYIGDRLSTFSNEDIRLKMYEDLDKPEMFKMVTTLNPKIHSINSFFTFFVINEHSKISDKLNGNEVFRMAFAGYANNTGDELAFAGYQSKEFYEFCEFLTVNDLWPDRTDIHNRAIQSRGFIKRHVINAFRKVIFKVSGERLCKPYDASVLTKPVRGYRFIIDELHKAGRQDLIDLCLMNSKSNLKESLYPMVLRTIAEIGPTRLMDMGAEEAVKKAISIYYHNKYKVTFIQKLLKVYIPGLIKVILVFSRLFKTK